MKSDAVTDWWQASVNATNNAPSKCANGFDMADPPRQASRLASLLKHAGINRCKGIVLAGWKWTQCAAAAQSTPRQALVGSRPRRWGPEWTEQLLSDLSLSRKPVMVKRGAPSDGTQALPGIIGAACVGVVFWHTPRLRPSSQRWDDLSRGGRSRISDVLSTRAPGHHA